MILYESFGGDYYALCSTLCVNFTSGYLTNPSYAFKPATEHDDTPFCCWWCGTAIYPETWGKPLVTSKASGSST